MSEGIEGPSFIAQALKHANIAFVFGIVGIPVTPISVQMQKEGLAFYGMRNEQAASYAASAVGYLTRHPAVCLTVAGPGMLHALPGLLNAQANNWPMILLSATCESAEKDRASFQEAKQLDAALPFVKHAIRVEHLWRFPAHLEKAIRISKYGKPGPVYIEIPGDVIKTFVQPNKVTFPQPVPEPPRVQADTQNVAEAVKTFQNAKKPLVIVGLGAAYSRAEKDVNDFLNAFQLPFLASPMAKGVVRDDSPLSVSAARSTALQEADVILLIGQTLNWMYHFGDPPRFSEHVTFIQLEQAAEELHTDKHSLPLLGDIPLVLHQLAQGLTNAKFTFPKESPWWSALDSKRQANIKSLQQQMESNAVPLTYHRVLNEIRKLLSEDTFIINEGANTLDIGRTVIPNFLPRRRLDSGVLGTMGVGLGYAIAAAAVSSACGEYSTKTGPPRVVAIEGDSAFGFSGMEVEVACRYQLPITFIILNNNGIYTGTSALPKDHPIPPTVFVPDAHYERIIEAFGGKGFYISQPDQLHDVLKKALSSPVPTIVNIAINPEGPIPRNVQQDQGNKRPQK